MFTLCLVIQTIGFLFVIFCVPEVKLQDVTKTIETNSENNLKKKPSFKELLSDFFDSSHIVDAFAVLKRHREGNGRKILIYVILCNTMFFATVGEGSLYFLFARAQLNWTIEFSIFIMYITATSLIGTGISTFIFTKMMNMSDPVLGIISTIGTIISNPVIVSLILTFL